IANASHLRLAFYFPFLTLRPTQARSARPTRLTPTDPRCTRPLKLAPRSPGRRAGLHDLRLQERRGELRLRPIPGTGNHAVLLPGDDYRVAHQEDPSDDRERLTPIDRDAFGQRLRREANQERCAGRRRGPERLRPQPTHHRNPFEPHVRAHVVPYSCDQVL